MYRGEVNQHYNQIRNVNSSAVLKVVGEGRISVTPDRVEILLGVISEEATVASAQQTNATFISGIIQAILNLGISRDRIQTSTFRIDPQYDYLEGEQVFRGYRVAHLLKLTLDQVEQAGTVIDVAVEQGANTVASIIFTIRDPSTIYQAALVQAIEEANQKASVMSNAIGVALHPIPIKMTEINKTAPIPYYPAVLSAQVGATPIQEGELTISAAVELEYTYLV
ncbi:SIMPL domain-containing protein [Alkalihalobacillus sp. MEB130]|uniref:SIMPL domain-containing protein n=1 Tax=Alkalihalobacillus sp. MEB130 TaxID=2976704 RepID=UPI0028DE4AAC|nr:SIMPL domain-containing protein [Alkalihalobacillus sp. MEB130]MDT8860107.1 SIMPL domain-containing protein [Alkalihalobacillus sp. MEB130]